MKIEPAGRDPKTARPRKTRGRGLFKWLILVSTAACTFFYISYFWAYMVLRGVILLGGRNK